MSLAECAPAGLSAMDLGRVYPESRRVACVLDLAAAVEAELLQQNADCLGHAQLRWIFSCADAAVPALLCGSLALSDGIISLLEVPLVVLAVVATHSDRAEAHSFGATLASPSAIVEIKLRLLRAASAVLDNERAASPCSHLALLCLLVLTLNGKAAGVAANALVEQTKITQILASSLLDTASDGYPRAGAGAAEVTTLATVAMSTLHKLISVHGAAASSVLTRCGIELDRLLNRLPGRGGSQHQMSLDLCELFATLAKDPALAARMCCPRLLEALKQPLISGRPDLQLAAIDVLTSIERHVQGGAQALCAEDIVSFLLELLRTPPPVMPGASLASRDNLCRQSSGGGGGTGDKRDAGAVRQQQAELRGGAIALLGELLLTPQRHSSTLLARVVGALWPVARGTTQEARRHLHFPGLRGTQAQLQALNAEHAPQPLTMPDRVGALMEFHANARCAASLLGWYQAQPTDVAHVLGFCRDGARLIKSFEGEPVAGHALQGDPRADQLRSRLAAATDAHQRTVTLSLVADLVAAALRGGAADAAACTSVLQLCDSLVLPMLLQTLASRVADAGPETDDRAECSLTATPGDGVFFGGAQDEAAALGEAALAALVGSAIKLLLLLLGDSALGDETRLEFAHKQSRDCLWLLDLATQANLPASQFTVALLAVLGRVPDPEAQRLDHAAPQHGLAPRGVLAANAPSDLAGCVAELRVARHAVPLHALELLLLILEHARAATDSEDGSAAQYELDGESQRQVAAGYSALRAVASAHYGSLHTKVPVATLRRFASACLLPMLEGAASQQGYPPHAPSADSEMAYAGLTHALLYCTPREVLQDPSCVAWLAGCATHARAGSGSPYGASTSPDGPSLDGEGGGGVAAWRMLLACALECYGPVPSAAEELHPPRHGEAQPRGLNPPRHGGDAPQLAAGDGDRLRNSLVCGCRAVGAHTAEMLVSLLAAHLQTTAMVPGGVVAALALTHAFIFGPHAWAASDAGDGGNTPTRSREAGAAVELYLRQLVAAGLNTAMSRLFLYSNLDDEALALAFRLVAACFSATTTHGELGASDACLLEALHHALGSAGRLLASGGSLPRAMGERRGGAPAAAHEWHETAACATMQLELLNLINVALAVARSEETHLAVACHPELLVHASQLALGAAGECDQVATESQQQQGVRLGALALLVQVLDKAIEGCTRQQGRAVPVLPPHLAAVLSDERLSLSSLLATRALSQTSTMETALLLRLAGCVVDLRRDLLAGSAPAHRAAAAPSLDVRKVLSVAVNASLQRGTPTEAGLACLALSLTARHHAAPTALLHIARHPWSALIFERFAAEVDAETGTAQCVAAETVSLPWCAYWSAILECKPQWTHTLVVRKKHSVDRLVCALANVHPLAFYRLRLLQALAGVGSAAAQELLLSRQQLPHSAENEGSQGPDPVSTDGTASLVGILYRPFQNRDASRWSMDGVGNGAH